MPLYSGGRASGVVLEFLQDQFVVEQTLDGNYRFWVETHTGDALVLTPADCEEIGNAIAGLATP